jgi:preprotein translocase subunit SecG
MTTGFMILTVLFIIVSAVMILIVLVQRPQGGGLAGAFGGASGGGTDTVFGGRVGDALTVMTVIAFTAYLLLAIGLNVMDNNRVATVTPAANVTPADPNAPATQPDSAAVNVPTGSFAPTGTSDEASEIPVEGDGDAPLDEEPVEEAPESAAGLPEGGF